MRKLFLLAGLAIAAPVLAVPTGVNPFELPLPGTTAAAQPDLAGTVISDTLVPFASDSASAPMSGTVQVRVVRNAAGKLVYYWKINNAATSKANVTLIAFLNFPKNVYDANWRTDGLGTVAPSSVYAMVSPADFMTLYYGFRFSTPLKPGESSRFFFLRTQATQSVPGIGQLVGSVGFANVQTLGPAS